MKDDDFVRLVQERLASAGYYTGRIDGAAGPATMAALNKSLPPIVVITPQPDKSVDAPYDDIVKLRGVKSPLAELVYETAERSPIPFKVTEGLRTIEKQRQYYASGASKTMDSRHLTGHAVDLWPLDSRGNPLKSDAAFPKGSKEAREASAALWAGLRKISEVMKQIAKERGVALEWGGDWGWDAPHFQLNRKQYP